MQRGLLVWNARSGARDEARRARITERLAPSMSLQVLDLEGEAADAAVLAAITPDIDIVIAAGGDGTVSTCATAAIQATKRRAESSPAPRLLELAIIPCGTANSIAAALGLPTDVDAACDVIATGTPRRVDAARVGDRVMVHAASIGFPADTIESTPSEAKSSLGKLAYILRGIAHLGDFEPFTARIETERGSTELRAMALTVANVAPRQTLFAQGAPELVPDDGFLDLTVVSAETALEALAAGIDLAFSALSSSEAQSPYVGWVRCHRVRVVADPPQPILVDGDLAGTTPLDVEIIPGGLAVRSPRAA